MGKIVVTGGTPLTGEVVISGSKNAVLPIIAASLLAEDGQSTINDVPFLADVSTICEVLARLGAKVESAQATLKIDCTDISSNGETPYEYMRRMRASFLVLGPLLARVGRAKLSVPGGCAIGTRPIDLHLKGMGALGAEIISVHGTIEARASQLTGAKVYLDFPSVGATENIMMAATLAKGVTVIENVAEEPEIVDLANFLNAMGARITGAGTKVIRIEGVKSLHGTTHTVIPDRIEAGTYMVAAAASGGNVLITNVILNHLNPMIAKLKEAGMEVQEENGGLRVFCPDGIKAADIKTMPYPGFPTDMQPQMMAFMTRSNGTSVITETVFENRFMHVAELKRMGADVKIEGHSAIVRGVKHLTGAKVKATDLRAGAALVVAGLMAEGQTEISCIHHVDRGYENIVGKLQALGANIRRVEE